MSENRRLWRYVAYATGALVLLVMVLAVGSWLAVRAWGPLLARDRVDAALTAALGRPVHVGDVAIEAWRGRVVISAVTAEALPGEPGPHFLTLARADVQIGISSLWRRRLVLRMIRFDEVDLRLSPGKGGATVVELPLLPPVIQAGWVEVELRTVEVRRARLLYEDPAGGTRVQASGVTITARPGRDPTPAPAATRRRQRCPPPRSPRTRPACASGWSSWRRRSASRRSRSRLSASPVPGSSDGSAAPVASTARSTSRPWTSRRAVISIWGR